MGADPESFLRKLEPGREVAAGEVRGLAAALPALAGLVDVRKDGRKVLVRLTAEGEARRASLPAAAARAKKPASAKPTLATVVAQLAALGDRVARLEAALATASSGGPDVKRAVLDTVAELDDAGRLGGLVPIPDLRAALRARGVADDRAVTAALEELERDWKIDLNVAQAPTAVADRAAGIERPGRGLLYYVSRR